MSEELKPPVAIRITRPYDTEEQYLEREFDTLTRTSIVLLGAQPRPQGVVLRFEIVLKGGGSLVRGEGRVVGYKERAYGGEPGLTLRFTRLDSKSKTVVDRAATLREARVRASTSLMSMPAVVVPRPGDAPPPPPPPAAPAPFAPRVAPPSPPPLPPMARSITPVPGSRKTPPPLPLWARSSTPPPLPAPPPAPVIPPEPPSVPIDIDVSVDEFPSSTQVTALPVELPLAEPALAEPALAEPALAEPVLAEPELPAPPVAEEASIPEAELAETEPELLELEVPVRAPPPPPAARAPIPPLPPAVFAPPPPPPSPPRPPVPPSPRAAPEPRPVRSASDARAVVAPPNRDALLDRLRTRARALSPDAVRAALTKNV